MLLPTKRVGSVPVTRFARGVAALFLVCLLSSCAGYTLEADSPSIFGSSDKTLKIKEVDYPTLQPWLPYVIRSSLRDEINARHLATWVDSGPADFEMQIKVVSYTTNEWMSDEIDHTMLFSSSMVIEATVYDGSTNKVVWRSGPVAYSDVLEQANERLAANDLVTQIVRQTVDKMRNTF